MNLILLLELKSILLQSVSILLTRLPIIFTISIEIPMKKGINIYVKNYYYYVLNCEYKKIFIIDPG